MKKQQQKIHFWNKYKNVIRLLIISLGICCSYGLYGYLQEQLITKSELGATFVLVIQTFVNIIVASVWKNISTTQQEEKKNNNNQRNLNHPLLFLTTTCYVCAMCGSNESLRFVSYPVAVLAKSCKLIPMMIMGRLIEKRQYAFLQWMAAFCISAGIALFNYSRINNNQNQKQDDASNQYDYWKGIILLCISLSMDGFLGACQGILKRPSSVKHRPPTAVETMFYINFYALFLLIPLAYVTNQMETGIVLLTENEELRTSVLILTGVVSIGQIFIFLCISYYSSLVTTTITTTRKFLTILFSVFHFGHAFTYGQWVSVVLVFGGLYLSIVASSSSAEDKKPTDKSTKKMD